MLACAEADDASDFVPECCEPPPFWVVAPEELALLAFAVDCGDAGGALPAALELPLLAPVPEAPVEPVVVAVVCCWGGELF